jgi:hypothetical protein
VDGESEGEGDATTAEWWRRQPDLAQRTVTAVSSRHDYPVTRTQFKAMQKSSIYLIMVQPIFVHLWSHQQLSIEAIDTARE